MMVAEIYMFVRILLTWVSRGFHAPATATLHCCCCHARALLSAMLMKRAPTVMWAVAVGRRRHYGRVRVAHPRNAVTHTISSLFHASRQVTVQDSGPRTHITIGVL